MRRFGIPVLPLIIGVILGPQLEYQLSQALAIDPSISTLWSEPVAVAVYVVIAVGAVVLGVRSRVAGTPTAAGDTGATVSPEGRHDTLRGGDDAVVDQVEDVDRVNR
jgi:putative tricarboxylic transport membrane protein